MPQAYLFGRPNSALLKSDAREKRGFPSQGAFLHCVQSAPSDSALLKSDAREKRGFPSQGAFLHCVQSAPSDSALLKSDAREKRGFPSQGAFLHCVQSAPSDSADANSKFPFAMVLGSTMPHTTCPSKSKTQCRVRAKPEIRRNAE